MLSLESCREQFRLLGFLTSDRADGSLQRLTGSQQTGADAGMVAGVARDFASVFYSMLIKQMQQVVRPEGDASAVADGAWSFFGMFLPQAIAGQAADPLARYILGQLAQSCGGAVDEQA